MAEQPQDFDEQQSRRSHVGPHSGGHPIPTIQGYRQHRKDLNDRQQQTEAAQEGPEDESKPKRAFESVKTIFKGEDDRAGSHEPYSATNRHYVVPPGQDHQGQLSQLQEQEQERGIEQGQRHEQPPRDDQGVDTSQSDETNEQDGHQSQAPQQQQQQQSQRRTGGGGDSQEKTATEQVASSADPKEKRKAMKKSKRQTGGREVTDPVTHLPIIIHDQTDKDLKSVPENEPEPGEHHTTATGPQGASKTDEELQKERDMVQRGHNGIQKLFPPPKFADLKEELASAYQSTLRAGLSVIGVAAALPFLASSLQGHLMPHWSTLLTVLGFLSVTLGTAWGMGEWISKKVDEIVDDETWDASRREEEAMVDSDAELPESVQWLNSFVASIWPLVNPDLFSSLIDMVEDIMQASLPKVVKMVSVDDMGQGNQSLRILGIRWLPSGAASRTVGPNGKLEKVEKNKTSDRTDPEAGQENARDETFNQKKDGDDDSNKTKEEEQSEAAMREGMEAEEGDFINLELAVAYRSRATGKSIRAKAKNAHLFLKFYSVGGIALPVWVEVRGFIATLRLRLQLTPDPPFVSLCTLTFLGQPKASLSCVPLSKHGLNLMDVPMLSSFVQSAIDAALAEYVAPKSLTLNLKDMLVGEDFKKNTTSHGVVFILIKRARGFKQGDGGIGSSGGSSDAYVTVGWGKFGKTVASTRIIESTQEPDWHEYANILVSSEELNAEEKLRLTLWDSDKHTADDDLGRVEVDLKKLMNARESYNQMQDREDRFTGQDPDEKMPGTLQWSVGYFSKVRILQQQLEQQTVLENIRSQEQLKEHVSEESANKLREAGKAPDDEELHQQRVQDYAELEDNMIISAPPPQEFPSGILSVQVHNITGLEVQKLRKRDSKNGDSDIEEETETGDDMPDSYCNIILNHKKIYRTRTKPKNSKPFFNAGTERFVRDWRTCEVIVAVRDARAREDDPLIGIVYLPIGKVLKNRSQLMSMFPLVGGIGFGRARISIVWRSVELKLPPTLLGWDYGTVEIRGPVRAKGQLPEKFTKSRIKIRSDLGRIKMYPNDNQGEWLLKGRDSRNQSAFLPVRKRYSSSLVLEFRESTLGPDKSPAFAVMWLRDLVDEESETKVLKVWKGGKGQIARAQSNCDYNGIEEGEQPLGEVEMELKFWRGLSGYHKRFAASSRRGNMKQVMECLDTITDESLIRDEDEVEDDEDDYSSSENSRSSEDKAAKKRLKVHTNDDSSAAEDTGSDTDGEGNKQRTNSDFSLGKVRKTPKKILRNPVEGVTSTAAAIIAPGHNDPDDGSRGLRNQLRDYKDHHKQLHRKHRGIMQWRVAREADHLGSKLSDLKGNVSGLFKHSEKGEGVETEV
ncbi:hypothetical protein KVR01_000123 [Diaporthe batatas]|uniref:uncharacterized protein n=1 Tax=Diaporthe batatas TaxID=748121 RepID=UPI001D036EFD|nr:uncharacterized protein KVR01_000123 [Diaporthe batatas]KAG8169378.1 hypothetical protein KVR01_000123 [Diaporthe batatas]